MDIPPFDGNLDHWMEFITSFNTFVHQNLTLTPLLKLHYLKTLLKKIPLSLISHLTTSAENYDVAYELITTHFSNPRRTFAHHLSKLTQSSTFNLKDFLSRCNSAISGLQQSTIEDKFDYLLLALSLNGLDKETRKAFEVGLKVSEVPTVANLLDFVKERVRVQDISACTMTPSSQGQAKAQPHSKPPSNQVSLIGDTPVKPPTPKSPRKQTTSLQSPPSTSHASSHASRFQPDYNSPRFTPRQNLRCPICQDSHRAYQCPSYSSATPQERLNWVRSNDRCTNCLGAHDVSRCFSHFRCLHCSQNHHSTLHDIFVSHRPPSDRNTLHSRPVSPIPLVRHSRPTSRISAAEEHLSRRSPPPLKMQPLVRFETLRSDRLNRSPSPLTGKSSIGTSDSSERSPPPNSGQN